MKLLKPIMTIWLYFCLATLLAESGILAVLWGRGQLTSHTLENLLVIAWDVPVRDMYDKLVAAAQPVNEEMISFADVETARTLTILDLDLRDLSADKGLADARELDLLVEEESNRYAQLKDDFDLRWEALGKEAVDSELLDVGRQIATVAPSLAKDQLLRILNDDQLEPEAALHHVVTIFRSLPVDKRKKIMLEFNGVDSASLHEILRQIRLGMPQITLIREARDRLNQFHTQK